MNMYEYSTLIHLMAPVFVYGASLTSLPVPGYELCPDDCQCSRDHGVIISADCSSRSLTSIPPVLPPSLKLLNLSRNNISEVRMNAFSCCALLEVLDLSWNQIFSLKAASTRSENQGNSVMTYRYDHAGGLTGDGSEDSNRHERTSEIPPNDSYNIASEVIDRPSKEENGSFSGLASLRFLSLHHNQITHLCSNVFSSSIRLIQLDISFNRLNHLESGALRALSSLERLYLQHNVLAPSSSTLSQKIFNDLISLKELNLHNNFPDNFPLSASDCYPDKALSKLINLEHLYIDGFFSNPSCVLGPGFRNLTKLSFLDMQIPGSICPIRRVSRFFFSNISTTENFNVSFQRCNIDYIQEDALSYLPTLISLDLSGCAQLNFEGFQNASVTLYKTNIKYLDISYIHRLKFVDIQPHYFSHLRNTSLEVLVMIYDAILSIDPKTIFNLPQSLRVWNLSKNQIRSAEFLTNLVCLHRLEILNVSAQAVPNDLISEDNNMPVYVWENVKESNRVNQSHNHGFITGTRSNKSQFGSTPYFDRRMKLSNHSFTPPDTLKVDLRKGTTLTETATPKQLLTTQSPEALSKYSQVSSEAQSTRSNWSFAFLLHNGNISMVGEIYSSFLHNNESHATHDNEIKKDRITPTFRLPRNLRQVYSSELGLRYRIPNFRVINNKVLEVWDISKNMLRALDGPISGFSALKMLDLSFNFCPYVSKHFFMDLNNLRHLSLSYNLLSDSLAHDISGLTFSYLRRLEKIELTHNDLHKLSPFIFKINRNLQIILLSHNSLVHFSPRISQLNSLQFLDLSFNQLTSLSRKNMDDLDTIQIRSNVTVNLLSNPLLCDCTTHHFILWYLKTHVTLMHGQLYNCTYIDGTVIPFQRISNLQEEMFRQCNGQMILTVVLALWCCTVTIYTMAALMYYYKHKIYFYLYVKRRLFFRQFWQSGRRYKSMQDVFLVYDDQDVKWRRHVLDMLIPNLTHEGILCHVAEIGFDEPSAGRPVRQVVEESVLRGWKTVILLTKHVFLDEENRLALSIARMVQEEMHSEVLIFLGAEKLEATTFSPRIRQYLRTCRIMTYLPQEPRFWFKLAKVIQSYRIL